MKSAMVKLLLVLVACLSHPSAFATPLDEIQKQVKEALCNGEAYNLSSLLDNEVVVNIQEGSSAVGKSRALPLIQNYIDKCKPYNFIVTHKTERMQSGYLMGNLQTSNGQIQFHIMLKKGTSNNFVIYQFRIEK